MTSKERDIENFIDEYAKKIIEGKASVFIGSGISRGAGLLGWQHLLEGFAKEIGLDVKKETDLISLAQYYVNNKATRDKLSEKIREFFTDTTKSPTENHHVLAALPITNYWTTNYDKLLERTFDYHHIKYVSVIDDANIKWSNRAREITLHKIHGDAESPDNCVITKEDYDRFSQTHEMLLAKLKAEMSYNTFLFLGYSFSDTDIQHILSRIRAVFGGKAKSPKTHYCILAKCQESEEDHEYKNTKQSHHIADLRTFGIQTILLDDYSEITTVLRLLRNKVCLQNVFITGSYPHGLEINEVEINHRTATTIAAALIANNFNIYTGYGMNVGVDIVQGAHDGCTLPAAPGYEKTIKWLNDHLFIYPFPYNKKWKDDAERKQHYTKWREGIIEKSQVTIVISGKKVVNGEVVVADGVLEEVSISRKQGNLIIPLAFTGGAAEQIW
ncbi:MAG: SIR2 family protein, partial [Firmicutes bacterium]|nr:SIR2 family protein [Bacillota bacterium]